MLRNAEFGKLSAEDDVQRRSSWAWYSERDLNFRCAQLLMKIKSSGEVAAELEPVACGGIHGGKHTRRRHHAEFTRRWSNDACDWLCRACAAATLHLAPHGRDPWGAWNWRWGAWN